MDIRDLNSFICSNIDFFKLTGYVSIESVSKFKFVKYSFDNLMIYESYINNGIYTNNSLDMLNWFKLLNRSIWLNKRDFIGIKYGLTIINFIFKQKNKIENKKQIYTEQLKNHSIINMNKLIINIRKKEKFPKMYMVDSLNKIRSWEIIDIEEQDNGHIIWSFKYGLNDGKKISKTNLVKVGKHIGKKNETTPYQQAIENAISMFKKKYKSGYRPSIESVKKKQNISPMLAFDWTKVKKYPKFPLYLQIKFDGFRIIATIIKGKIVFFKRSMDKIIIDLPEIKKELRKLMLINKNILKGGIFLDGEIVNKNISLQTVSSVLNSKEINEKKIAIRKKLQFVIFDNFRNGDNDISYELRYRFMSNIYKKASEKYKFNTVKIVDNVIVSSDAEIDKYLKIYSNNGEEGVIIRDPESHYFFGRTRKALFKYKLNSEETGEIVDINDNNEIGQHFVIVLKIKMKNGISFELTGSGPKHYQKEILANKSEYIGKIIRFKFNGLTDDNIPKFSRPIMRKKKYIIIDD